MVSLQNEMEGRGKRILRGTEGFWYRKPEATKRGDHGADDAEGEAAKKTEGDHARADLDPEDAHGESDCDLIEYENSDGGGHQRPDGGREDRLLNQASNDGESTVSQGLEGADLSDATRECGVRGVESTDDSAGRHEDGGDNDHESDGREEGGQGCEDGWQLSLVS